VLQVTFEQDVILSQANEYEVLQLLLGECKTRLGSYAGAPFSQSESAIIHLCLHSLHAFQSKE